MTIERRAALAELRAAGRRLEGYASTFWTEARVADFRETIARGAFSASLAAEATFSGLSTTTRQGCWAARAAAR
jgi:phage head maturation protease